MHHTRIDEIVALHLNEDKVQDNDTLTVKGSELYVNGNHFKVSNLKGETIDHISDRGKLVTKKKGVMTTWNNKEIKVTSYGR
jgi:hypothetical protein